MLVLQLIAIVVPARARPIRPPYSRTQVAGIREIGMGTLKEEVGGIIRHHRKLRGWSQEQLAEKAGRSVEMVNRIERGRTAPSFETLEVLSRCFQVPVRDLFGVGSYEAADRDDPMSRIVGRLSPLDRGDLDWVERLVTVALNRKVRSSL